MLNIFKIKGRGVLLSLRNEDLDPIKMFFIQRYLTFCFFPLLGESNGGYQVIHLIQGNWICSSVMLQHLGLPTHPNFVDGTQVPKMDIVAKDLAIVPGKRSTTTCILDFA